MCAPEGPKWGHIGVPKAFLGVSWASFLPLWTLLGTPGHPLGAVQEPLGTIFINLGAPRALTKGIFDDFSLNFKLFMYFFNVKSTGFHTPMSIKFNNPSYPWSPSNHTFPSNLSHPSFPPVLQASKHPNGSGGMRGAFESAAHPGGWSRA